MFKRHKGEDPEAGLATGTIILLVAGFAAVALVATLWIGNTTAGLAADTSNCVTAVGGSEPASVHCGINKASGADGGVGGGNALEAHNTRDVPPSFIQPFGATEASFDSENVKQALGNLDRGLLRFGGLKSSVWNDTQSLVNSLATAPTKDAALAILQQLRHKVYSAQRDGETPTSYSTIQSAANILSALNHPAADAAQQAQINANLGNQQLVSAMNSINSSVNNYSSLSLSQLRASASGIGNSIQTSVTYYQPAVVQLHEVIAAVNSNR